MQGGTVSVLEENLTSVHLSTESKRFWPGGSGLPAVGGGRLTSSLTAHISMLQYILQRKSVGRRRDGRRRKGGEGEM